MFRLDESAVNRWFGQKLDLLPSGVGGRSAGFFAVNGLSLICLPLMKLLQLMGRNDNEIGLTILFPNNILKCPDAIELVVDTALNRMVVWMQDQHALTIRPVTSGSLTFEYDEEPAYRGVLVTMVSDMSWNSF